MFETVQNAGAHCLWTFEMMISIFCTYDLKAQAFEMFSAPKDAAASGATSHL